MYVEIFMCNLLENQLRSYYLDNRIRIDFNLNNFVVKDNILYLVDVMPPIFIDRVVEEKSKRYNRLFNSIIKATCAFKTKRHVSFINGLCVMPSSLWVCTSRVYQDHSYLRGPNFLRPTYP